ncbi:zinc finger protein OZF-like [Wyeomyia smithii]|uniref:zinc finger protein OZF-like n=1 Tax=Wyeomyia smithii TaxID=174621 RepID=UPI0024680544|nr:zinc finger protein OZF-like [Wyeomyia smithii]
MQSCRVCVETVVSKNSESLFSDNNMLANIIQELCGLEILRGDGLPEYACEKCCWNLKAAFKLKQQCIASDRKLRNCLKQEKETIDTLETETDAVPMISFKVIYDEILEPEPIEYVDTVHQRPTEKETAWEKPVKSPEIKSAKLDNFTCTTVRCCGCETIFESNDELVTHSKKFHESQRTSNEERPFECTVCYKRYISEKGLKLHKKGIYHIKQFQCVICGKRFNNTINLTNHERSHSKLKPFECTHCPKSFGSRSNLLAHLKLHSMVPEHTKHVCNLCGKGFSRKSYLKHHFSLLHSEETPFACTFCSSKFKAKANLRLHLRTHTQERPYSCELCDRTFMYPTDRKRHMIQHTGQKPFKCNDCDKAFTRKALLRKHRGCHETDESVNIAVM